MNEPDPAGPRRALAAMIVVAVLLGVGLLIVQHLRREAVVEDCLMAGRSNCTPLQR